MKKTEKLFELIHSLTKNEKGYFKKNAAFHKIGAQNQYVKLFDAIEKQTQYHEEAIKKKYRNEGFVKHLAFNKVYLYHLILKSLQGYHSDLYSQVLEYLNRIKILYNKGLYEHCTDFIEKVKNIADKHELFVYKYEALMWERKVMGDLKFRDIPQQKLSMSIHEGSDTLEKIKNYYEYLNISHNFLIKTERQIGGSRNKEEVQVFRSVLEERLMKGEDKANSITSKYLYNFIHVQYHRHYTGNWEKMYHHQKRAADLCKLFYTELFNNPPDVENIYRFLGSHVDVTISCYMTGRYDEGLAIISNVREIMEKNGSKLSTSIRGMNFFYSYSSELRIYLRTGRFDMIDEVIDDIEKRIEDV